MNTIGGIATCDGKRFAFPVDHGYGLVTVDGKTNLYRFACPLESMPPQGAGTRVDVTVSQLTLQGGILSYQGEQVVLGTPFES